MRWAISGFSTSFLCRPVLTLRGPFAQFLFYRKHLLGSERAAFVRGLAPTCLKNRHTSCAGIFEERRIARRVMYKCAFLERNDLPTVPTLLSYGHSAASAIHDPLPPHRCFCLML
jgi:hypothetical protein